MSIPGEPRGEHPSTYFVQDRSSQEELSRLQIQSQMLTASMGGVLSEQADITRFRHVLDVACGTGDWLIQVAKNYPEITKLIGVDISAKMLHYARTQAEAQQVGDRIEFVTMDALRMLAFPDNYFDLVNQRFGFSFIRTWDWPELLSEYVRVARSGGVIRITEPSLLTPQEVFSDSALIRLSQIQLQAFYQAGHFFTLDGDGIIAHLARLLRQFGLQSVQTHLYNAEYRGGTVQGQRFCDDMKHLFKTAIPFYRKWTRLPDDYDILYQQMVSEMQQPDFVSNVHLLTAWGIKP